MLEVGQTAEVKGSAAKPYIIKNVDGIIWSCTCPAWRNSGGAVDQKTCKHVKQIRGSAAPAPSPIGTPAPKVVTATPERAEEIMARAAAQGRKLRQDEKAKLNGPPVLLAHPYEGSDIDPTGWWISEKLDGVRAYWDGENFISRQGNVFHAPAWFKAGLPKDLKLDGELWIDRGYFQNTLSVVRTLDAGERWKPVQFVVFDVPDLASHTFEQRMDFLEEAVLSGVINSKILRVHSQSLCKGKEHLKTELDRIVALKGEGLMLREPKSYYEIGRSSTLLKVKPFKDAEAVVVGHEPGKGKHKGRLGGLVVEMPDGKRFNVGSGLTDDDRRSPPQLGVSITYRYTELTNDGIPKCASFVCVRNYE